ncbi:uncharacterized protein MELLADRAFT_110908 [Melampsora larici-populina 98AG31]|uniref:Uncharacterized protein n=1 Tax=Melampsora larici-populina (strain 98AG31 / pathotype 3-4-7) TaxID=747676 RepID=F4S1E6_MELLP|nr:uncharacterized protein MELLADRAFT_110908 [Melampsora larici-populina 98AG31]EGG01549.1 hypothetical protein MELLADRAFT_110908 [Melampsora larici-populina 98AG31]
MHTLTGSLLRYIHNAHAFIHSVNTKAASRQETSPGQLESQSLYYGHGRIILSPGDRWSSLHTDEAVLVRSTQAPGTLGTAIDATLVTSIGRVEECHYSTHVKRWVVTVVHRDWDPTFFSTVSFTVEYTLGHDKMVAIGIDMFQIGRVLTFNGDVIGQSSPQQRWIINYSAIVLIHFIPRANYSRAKSNRPTELYVLTVVHR